MANMSPEDRERFMARMREGGGRGGSRGGPGGLQTDAAQGRESRGGAGRLSQGGQTRQAPSSPLAMTNATTIDALFAPLTATEGRGRLWIFANKQLKAVNVRTGISDGTWTEILEGGDAGQLQPETEVVVNIVTGLEPQARPGQQSPGSSPLMPQRGGPRGGGPGGGGGGRGR